MTKKLFSGLVAVLLVLSLLPVSLASTPQVGGAVGINLNTGQFAPRVYMDPATRIFRHNAADGGTELVERTQNYAFEGEQLSWDVVVWDKNGREQISNVHVTIGTTQGVGNQEEVECVQNARVDAPSTIGARDDEGNTLAWDANTMLWYTCIFTVEPQASMYGEYFVVGEATDKTGLMGTFDENELWFLNPVVGIQIRGNINFGAVNPGQRAYSSTIIVTNAADEGSAVVLNMSISGTDFYDAFSSGARCPASNVLSLTNFRYYATNGAYSSSTNAGADVEGYDAIPYETSDPSNRVPMIDANPLLSQGSDIALTLRLDIPQPCIGDFSAGNINFWGRVV
ncbi:MAG TPA: hypothetical protein VI894_03855 [Candidatus Nanoarchaeia archaeon]|nr:hypothetical protein [Candidatus Nanoarchaeia archaeon]